MKTFQAHFSICYADTDAGGVVYHSRYIDMAERARMEMLHELGISCRDLEKAEKPCSFMIHKLEIEYKRPALLEDELTVETQVLRIGGATFDLLQTVKRGDETLVEIKVYALAVAGVGKPTRIPAPIREKFAAVM